MAAKSCAMKKKCKKKLIELSKRDAMFEELKMTEVSTPHLLLLNCGLQNGVTRPFLWAVLRPSQIYMFHHKEYSVATFSSASEAEYARSIVNGCTVHEVATAADDLRPLLPTTVVRGPPLHVHAVFLEGLGSLKLTPFVKRQLPPGLVLVQDFISPQLEQELLDYFTKHLAEESFKTTAEHNSVTDGPQCSDHLKQRRVEHFGYQFLYGQNCVDPKSPLHRPIPDLCHPVLKLMMEHKLAIVYPDQLTVNEYQPGQGIPKHVDSHSSFEGEIISLSLGSDCIMHFKGADSDLSVPVCLQKRSLLVMGGDSRLYWTHRIPSHKLDQVDCSMPGMDMPHPPQVPHPQWVEETTDVMERLTRISLTFRKVQQSPNCSCGHHLCDKRDQLTSPHGPLV